jgi:DNA recombination protein RmuC
MLSLGQIVAFTLLAVLTAGLGVGFGLMLHAKRTLQAQIQALQTKDQAQSERLVTLEAALEQHQQQQVEMAQALAAARVESAQKEALVLVNQQLEQRNEHWEQVSKQQQHRINELQEQQHQLAVQLKQKETEQVLAQAHHEQRLQWFTEAKQQLAAQFEQLAHQALQQNSDRFSKNQQDHLSHLLTPFKEQLTTFQKKLNTPMIKKTEIATRC